MDKKCFFLFVFYWKEKQTEALEDYMLKSFSENSTDASQ